VPEVVASTDDKSNRKAGRVSANAAAAPNLNLMLEIVASGSEEGESVSDASKESKEDESMESIGALIQDLFHSDNARVNAALDGLDLDLDEDEKKGESLFTAGCCFALVQLVKECLKKAMDKFPACDQFIDRLEVAELNTLYKTLFVFVSLTDAHGKSMVGISSVGDVEAVVEAMKTFPKCHDLQDAACDALGKLVECNLGKKNAVVSGGLQLLLVAVDNHLNSATVCEYACWTLSNIVEESKENTRLLINLGGAAAVAKVRQEWLEDDDVRTVVRRLAKSIGTEINSWADEEEENDLPFFLRPCEQ
jgi:hypothetical protein